MLAGGPLGGRGLWGLCGRTFCRRVDVPPSGRCFEGGAGSLGPPPLGARIRSVRLPNGHPGDAGHGCRGNIPNGVSESVGPSCRTAQPVVMLKRGTTVAPPEVLRATLEIEDSPTLLASHRQKPEPAGTSRNQQEPERGSKSQQDPARRRSLRRLQRFESDGFPALRSCWSGWIDHLRFQGWLPRPGLDAA